MNLLSSVCPVLPVLYSTLVLHDLTKYGHSNQPTTHTSMFDRRQRCPFYSGAIYNKATV